MCKKTTMEYRETNKVHLKGKIAKSLTFSHEFFGEKFLETSLLCERMSGVVDILPIIFPERIGNLDLVQPDTCIDIQGRIKTYNKKEEGSIRNKLIINVYLILQSKTSTQYSSSFICRKIQFTPFIFFPEHKGTKCVYSV